MSAGGWADLHALSAIRVIGRRHSAFDNLKMAEISVPAWLMPMKKTKFVM